MKMDIFTTFVIKSLNFLEYLIIILEYGKYTFINLHHMHILCHNHRQ